MTEGMNIERQTSKQNSTGSYYSPQKMPSSDGEDQRALQLAQQESILTFASPAPVLKGPQFNQELMYGENATTKASSNASQFKSARVLFTPPQITDAASPDACTDFFMDPELLDSHRKTSRDPEDLSPLRAFDADQDCEQKQVKPFDIGLMSDDEELCMIDEI